MGPGPAREPVASPFAGLLRQLRISAGLTQEQLALSAGLSPRSISDLERGINQTARRETVRLLADALHLTGTARAGFQASARGLPPSQAFPAGVAATATRTLPRDVGTFTGRQPELRAVVRLAGSASTSGGVVGICAIGGMAGIGKTAFAIHAAHELAPSFPDGQIFLSLHAHTPGQLPVDSGSALASLLMTAGVDSTQIPAGVEERSRLWRDRLAGKQVLLVLDDAAGYDQVKPLLPGTAGSLVLITSRRHLTALDDVSSISLDTLPPDEAAALLIRLSGRPGLDATIPAIGEIVRLCGYLPLAIGMMAGRLRHHPAWSVSELAADLASARDRLDLLRTEDLSVAAAFNLSYQDLVPEQQRLFRRLGLHGGADIDVYAAAALDDADLGTTRVRLEALYNQYLINEHAAGRYLLHDLMREHARALAAADPAAETSAARDRLMSYYLRTARSADVHLARRAQLAVGEAGTATPRFATREEASQWLERERLNVDALILEAIDHDQPGFATDLAAAMHAFLRFHGHWDHALKLHKIALGAALHLGDERAQARALTNLGDIELATRDYRAAATSLSKAMQACRNLGDRPGEAATLTQLGATLYLTGDHQVAAEHLARALELYRELDDLPGEALALSRLGSVQIVTGDYLAAGTGLSRAYELYHQLGDRLGEAYALTDLGAVRQATGMYREATADLARALEIYRELGDRLGEANALLDLGSVQHATGDYAAALAGLTDALDLSNSLDDRLGKANVLLQLGAVQHSTGNSQAAGESQHAALDLYRQLRDRTGESDALVQLAQLALEAGEPAPARAYFEQAHAIAIEIASPLAAARALEGIGRCDQRLGRADEGAAALAQALAIYQRIGSPRASTLTLER